MLPPEVLEFFKKQNKKTKTFIKKNVEQSQNKSM